MPPTPPKPNYPPRPVASQPAPDWSVAPVETFRPPTARHAEAAAKAAQHVYDLEADLALAQGQVAQLKNLLQLEEERNKVLTADLKSAQLDRDYYQKRNTEIMTKLTIAGSLVLDAMKEPPEREDPGQRAAISEASQRALSMAGEGLSHDPPETGGHS